MAVLVLDVDHRVAAVALGAGGGGVDVLPLVLHVINDANIFSRCTLHFSSFWSLQLSVCIVVQPVGGHLYPAAWEF
jgi:hypothetical protein